MKEYKIEFRAMLDDSDVRAMKSCFYDAMNQSMSIKEVWDLDLTPVDCDAETKPEEKTSYQQKMDDIAEKEEQRSKNFENIQIGDICMYPFYEDGKNKSKCLVEVVDIQQRKNMDKDCFFFVVKFLVVGNDDSGNGLFTYLKKTGRTMNVSPGYCKKVLSFKNGTEMLNCVQEGDLYSPSTGTYVFEYNEEGAIATYDISLDEAENLIRKANESDDYWGAFLGIGGTIYDAFDESDPPTSTTNLDKCAELAEIKDWVPTNYFKTEEDVK